MKHTALTFVKALMGGTILLSASAFATTKVEESYPLKFGAVETVVQQILLSDNGFPSRAFYIPANIEKEVTATTDSNGNAANNTVLHPVKDNKNAPVIFIPDIARGGVITEDLEGYIRDFSTYIPALLGGRDIYIYPGRVVEGSYIHNCGLVITNWATEFADWQSTKEGVARCAAQLGQFNYDMSVFSTDAIVKDLAMFINDEKLNKPVIWALGGQADVANGLAHEMGNKLGGVVIDNPNLAYRADAQNAFSEFLGRVDNIAVAKDWAGDKKPSELLNEMIASNNAGTIFEGDIANIGYNEDINRLFPVNGDVLNYYTLAKADQPEFLSDLSQGNSTAIYRQFAPFSLESYGAVSSFPEVYRNCTNIGQFSNDLSPDNLNETFVRDIKRQQAICEALGASTEYVAPKQKIKIPATVIVSAMDPYYSSGATQAWMAENYNDAALVYVTDGGLGTPECAGEPFANMIADIATTFNSGKVQAKEYQCNWSFKKAE